MSEDLPLEGLRVLDLTTVIMGPFTTQVLGDFGADIIKIEDPNGDMTRDIGPSRSDKMSSMYLGVNRNKTLEILEKILSGETPKPGSYRGRVNNEPENNRKTLMDLKNA